MATTNYIDLVNPVAAVVDKCPALIIVEAVKTTVIDLCERGQVWKYIHPDVVLTAGTYSYSFIPPDSQTFISFVETARVNNEIIDVITSRTAIINFPQFPDTADIGPPLALWQMDQRSFKISPTPDSIDTYTLKLITTLKPTQNSTGADSVVISEHLETIVHGALHRLLLQQKREWFNADLAGYHGKEYTYRLGLFKAAAMKGFGRVNISVAMIPFA